MINSYLKTGVRHIIKHRSFAIINIAGLALGLTCFAFIACWVHDELSFDKFHKNHDRIFRVTSTLENVSGTAARIVTAAPMAQSLLSEFPEISTAVRMKMRGDIVRYHEQHFYQSDILLADPTFFDVFTFKLLVGNKATALNEPYSIVLTESSALKYFGNENPMGKTLTINMYDGSGYGADYKVTGIMQDPPASGHFVFSMIASFKTIETATPSIMTVEGWRDPGFYTYILLNEEIDHRALSNKINKHYQHYLGNLLKAEQESFSFNLQPLTDIHLKSHLQNEIQTNGSFDQVILFSSIGLFILFLAGINYVNLSIANSTKRAKEVGVKKIVGAKRIQLFIQYLLESVMTALIALVLALILTYFIQPWFFQFTGKNVSPISSPSLLFFLTIISITVGTLSGLYPAVIISGLQPLRILKGNFSSGRSGLSLRESLVVTQFTITIVLVSCIVVINSQMRYLKHKNPGYNKDALIYLRIHGNTDVIKGYEPFRNELLTNPLIPEISTSNTVPIAGLDTGESETQDRQGNPIQITTAQLRVDSNYLSTYGIPLVAGRNFTGSYMTDSLQPVLLNEEAVRSIGLNSPLEAVGRSFKVDGKPGQVIGVVRNFHFSSMHDPIRPLLILPVSDRFSRITIKIQGENGAAIGWMKDLWRKHFPSALFDYDFVDAQVGLQYSSEERLSQSIVCFSLVSLLIACLGLYGLVAHHAGQRVKEIGIRKVLGATVNGITLMLSQHYLKLVLISSMLALPIAWYAMSGWLQTFAWRISITWWMPVSAAVLVIFVSMLTVLIQAIKAASMNPTASLKTN